MITPYIFQAYRGDTRNAMKLRIAVEGLFVDFAGATVELLCKQHKTDIRPVLSYSTTAGTIAIGTDTNELFLLERSAAEMNIKPGIYFCDLQVTDAGRVTTYLKGWKYAISEYELHSEYEDTTVVTYPDLGRSVDVYIEEVYLASEAPLVSTFDQTFDNTFI